MAAPWRVELDQGMLAGDLGIELVNAGRGGGFFGLGGIYKVRLNQVLNN